MPSKIRFGGEGDFSYTPAMRRSPFPGMDPYIEDHWGDFHSSLVPLIRAAIQPLLPTDLRALSQEEVRLEVDDEFGDTARFYPDTSVIQVTDTRRHPEFVSSVATITPLLVREIEEIETRRWVEIVEPTQKNRVVTAIELLSPGNKASGHLNRSYRRKVRQYVEAGVNIVEIDLLRGSRERLSVPSLDLPADRKAAYYTCVHRNNRPGFWEVYPIPLRDRLPTIPIPLRDGESDCQQRVRLRSRRRDREQDDAGRRLGRNRRRRRGAGRGRVGSVPEVVR
jgi:hypothetical protein